MTSTIEKRLAAFEDTIHAAVRHYRIGDSEPNGMAKEDFVQILRATVWELLEEQDNAPRAYVCKAIWNRARDLMRSMARHRAGGQVVGHTASGRPLYATSEDAVAESTPEMSNPWEDCNIRLDLQKLFDTLRPEEVQILWMVAEHGRGKARGRGNKEVSAELGISPRTLSRTLARAREAARGALPAYAVQKENEA